MFYGYTLEGTYTDRTEFFFSLIPAVGIMRDGNFWSLQATWLNIMVMVFIGKEDEEDGEG